MATSSATGAVAAPDKTLEEQEAVKTAIEYAPIYALGNICIGKLLRPPPRVPKTEELVAGWLFFWLKESFTLSQLLVTINTAAQLFAVSQLPPLTASSHPLLRITHLVAKTFAGIGILDFVDNGAVALVGFSFALNSLHVVNSS